MLRYSLLLLIVVIVVVRRRRGGVITVYQIQYLRIMNVQHYILRFIIILIGYVIRYLNWKQRRVDVEVQKRRT